MNKEIGIGIFLTVAIAGGLAYWYYGPWTQPPVKTEPSAAPVAAEPVDEPIQYPAPATAHEAPLPALAESDPAFLGSLEQLFGKLPVDAYLVPANIIAQLVATLDSLDREPVPLRIRVVKPVPGALVVQSQSSTLFLGAKNYERYQPLMAVLNTVDGKTIAELYLRYYPLFQQAYVELGFPKGYFNDRLIKIMDHLLAAPEVKGPIALVRPTVAYKFADPELERRSSGQKLLIRLGAANAAAIKTKLREIRAVIAGQTPDAERP